MGWCRKAGTHGQCTLPFLPPQHNALALSPHWRPPKPGAAGLPQSQAPAKAVVGFGKGKPLAELPACLTKHVNRFLCFPPAAICAEWPGIVKRQKSGSARTEQQGCVLQCFPVLSPRWECSVLMGFHLQDPTSPAGKLTAAW